MRGSRFRPRSGDCYVAAFSFLDSPAITGPEIEALIQNMGLKPGDMVLDLGCGTGRHAIELAKRGMKVTGVDCLGECLAKAQAKARYERVELELVLGDFTELPLTGPWDFVLSAFSSLSYVTKKEHFQTLLKLRDNIRDGGHLLIDHDNKPRLLRQLQSGRREAVFQLPEGEVSQSAELDQGQGLVTTRFQLSGEKGRLRSGFRQHLYSPEDLEDTLIRAGYRVTGRWGSLRFAPYQPAVSTRFVIGVTPANDGKGR